MIQVPKHLLVPGQWVKITCEGFQLSLQIERAATYDDIIEVWGSEFVWEPELPAHLKENGKPKGYHLLMDEKGMSLTPIK
jgi:hypothetical protein